MSSAPCIRAAALVALCFQNATNTLLIRFSRGVLHESYSQLSTVLVSEILKLIAVTFILYVQPNTTSSSSTTTTTTTSKHIKNTPGNKQRRMIHHDQKGHDTDDDGDENVNLEEVEMRKTNSSTSTSAFPFASSPAIEQIVVDDVTSPSPSGSHPHDHQHPHQHPHQHQHQHPIPSSSSSSSSSRVMFVFHSLLTVLLSNPRLAVPGGIYLIQNLLQQMALQRLPAATYALLAQLKLLTTAVFSVWLLKRRLSSTQIRALLLLFIGVVLVLQAGNNNKITTTTTTTTTTTPAMIGIGEEDTGTRTGIIMPTTTTSSPATTATSTASTWLLGLIYALSVAVLSGFGGCYLEIILKSPPISVSGVASVPLSLWEANAGLSLWGLFFGSFSLVLLPAERDIVLQKGFFHGYSIVTAAIIILAAGGGIMVAIVVKYADNIIKGFAVTLSVVLTSLLSWALFGDVELDIGFVCGASVVLIAVANYNDPVAAPPTPPTTQHQTDGAEPAATTTTTTPITPVPSQTILIKATQATPDDDEDADVQLQQESTHANQPLLSKR